MICDDPMFGEKKWEAAESAMQKEAAVLAIGKAGLTPDDIRFVFAGDLLAQTIASSFGIAEMGIPFFGLYGACSTMGESLSLGAIAVSAGYGHHILCATSSHFASAEKEFRFPLGYGCQRPLSATWTVTGSAACILSPEAPHPSEIVGSSLLRSTLGSVAITGITTGKVIDFGFRDSLNMGGCMAPAACDTIYRHFEDFGRSVNDYDAVLTGDLGVVGRQILLDLLKEKNIDLSSVHQDCGLLIYDNQKQDTHSGGSGCGCAASVLAAYILPRVVSGFWKRVLFVPTGAMLSKVNFNAFWVGGLICALVQILLDKTKLLPGRVMVLLVCSGAVLSFLGFYQPFIEYAGAGASVPLLGFGNILWKGMKKAIDENGFLGLFTGGFTACAVGVSAALIFSYLASLIFHPRMKE